MSGNLNNREALLGLAMMAIGLGLFAASFGISFHNDAGYAPRVFPMAGALLIAALGALKLAGVHSGPSVTEGRTANPGPLLGLVALSVAYVVAITHVGYLVGTAFTAPVALWLFGIRSPVGLLAAFFLCPAIYHVIFFVGLGVFPPYGLWFDLLDVIQGY